MAHRVLIEFDNEHEAKHYRHNLGVGGWIFVPEEDGGRPVLFPPEMTPHQIYCHPITKGRSGEIIGSQ